MFAFLTEWASFYCPINTDTLFFLRIKLNLLPKRRRYFPSKMVKMLSLALTLLVLKFSLTEAIRVLQTNPAIELPPRLAQAEVLDSSLDNLDEFTICLRQALSIF